MLTVTVYLTGPEPTQIGGDEPHYLVMAESITRDHTLNLRAAYLRNRADGHIYPALDPHIRIDRRRWIPYHGAGLPILLAFPFDAAGVVAAKLTLCVMTGVLTLAMYWLFVGRIRRASTLWLTAGLVVCLPYCFGASQIYPDLLGGAFAAFLAVCLIRAEEEPLSATQWAIFWSAVGYFPWLNVKYFGATVILTAWALVVQWRQRRQLRWAEFATVRYMLYGVLSLAAFHYWGVGSPFGPRRLREIDSTFSRAALIFLGLHFDQSQGMFIQHPLLLAGVAAFPLFVWMRPLAAFFWIGLYASLIVPNSMELARWGGGGPVGRFAWSAEWLWAIPLGLVVADMPQKLGRFVKPVVLASLSYQALLALRWWQDRRIMFPQLEQALDARDSLFPLFLRPFVPSFYLWDFSSYWTYGPNVMAYAIVIALFAVGALPILERARR